MDWNGSGLDYFMVNDPLPAFHAAGLSTKVLVLDYNWSNYSNLGSVPMGDTTLTSDPLFGGIAWHGYGGDVSEQSTIHNEYPNAPTFDTEHSGGTWITNQQQVNWGGESFTYTLPAQTSATFTWSGTQSGTSLSSTGQVGGYSGMCLDVAGGNATDGTAADLYTCNGTTAQQWTVGPNGTVEAMNKCLDVVGGGTANGTQVDLYTCNGTGAQVWQPQADGAL